MEKINFSQSAVLSEEEVREIIGQPHELVIKKSISFLDEHCKRLISMSPLFFLSTANAEGKCDVSPRGDLPGTVSIINKHQIIIPDRPGNRRLDSILNIITNPNVGLVFLKR